MIGKREIVNAEIGNRLKFPKRSYTALVPIPKNLEKLRMLPKCSIIPPSATHS